MNLSPPPPPATPLQAVVFDLDGLMINTEDIYQQVGTELLARRGKLFEDNLRNRMMGQPSVAAIAVMIQWHGLSDTVEVLAAESEEVFWEFVTDRLEVMPGLVSLIDAIDRGGLAKAIATSGAQHYALELLERIGLRDRFELVLTAADIERGKPHPEIYHLAASRLGLPEEGMLVLEDSENGCRAAIASGAYTVAVPSHHTAGHNYTGVKFIAQSLEDRRIRQVLAIA